MGGIYFWDCNEIVREIFMWCKDRGIFLVVIYLFGKFNVEVDLVSRYFYDDMEWLLDIYVYNSLIIKWGNFEIDFFVLWLNVKLFCYVVWKFDLCVYFIDVFIFDWFVFKFVYCFLFFSVIGKVF